MTFATEHDVRDWDTRNVRDMTQVFAYASSYSHPIGAWDVSTLREAHELFVGSRMSTQSYDATLIGWANQGDLVAGATIDATGMTYCAATEHRAALVRDRRWRIQGDRQDCP